MKKEIPVIFVYIDEQIMMFFGDHIDYTFNGVEQVNEDEYVVHSGEIILSDDAAKVLEKASSVAYISMNFASTYYIEATQKKTVQNNQIIFTF